MLSVCDENITGTVEVLSLLNYLIKNLQSKTLSLVFLSCHGHFLFFFLNLICLLISNLTQSLDFSFSLWVSFVWTLITPGFISARWLFTILDACRHDQTLHPGAWYVLPNLSPNRCLYYSNVSLAPGCSGWILALILHATLLFLSLSNQKQVLSVLSLRYLPNLTLICSTIPSYQCLSYAPAVAACVVSLPTLLVPQVIFLMETRVTLKMEDRACYFLTQIPLFSIILKIRSRLCCGSCALMWFVSCLCLWPYNRPLG